MDSLLNILAIDNDCFDDNSMIISILGTEKIRTEPYQMNTMLVVDLVFYYTLKILLNYGIVEPSKHVFYATKVMKTEIDSVDTEKSTAISSKSKWGSPVTISPT